MQGLAVPSGLEDLQGQYGLLATVHQPCAAVGDLARDHVQAHRHVQQQESRKYLEHGRK